MQYDYGGGKKLTKYIFIQVSFFNIKLKFAHTVSRIYEWKQGYIRIMDGDCEDLWNIFLFCKDCEHVELKSVVESNEEMI